MGCLLFIYDIENYSVYSEASYYVEDPEWFGITTLNDMYLKEGRLNAQMLGRGYTWMDAVTFDSLRRATNFVCMIEQYQGMSISAPEEIAYRFHWIDKEQLKESAEKYGKSPYGEYLRAVLEDRIVV